MTTGRGFTLLELLVTIAIAGILAAVAIPSFRTIIISNRLSSAANEYIAALTEAKMQAVKRNRRTLFCGTVGTAPTAPPLVSACPSPAPSSGAVVALTGAGMPEVVRAKPPDYKGLSITNVRRLHFTGEGLARLTGSGQTALATGLIADISSAQLPSKNRRCIYIAAGSVISTCTVTGTGTTTCPNNEPTNCQ